MGLAKPGPKEIGSQETPNYRPTLAEAGISKKLSARSQKLAAIPQEEFEETIDEWRGRVEQENDRVTMKLLNKAERPRPEPVAPPVGQYSLIYADPPWRYDYSPTDSREIENQYPTMSLDEICNLDVPAHEDCVLYLWATSPKLAESMEVITAWGAGRCSPASRMQPSRDSASSRSTPTWSSPSATRRNREAR